MMANAAQKTSFVPETLMLQPLTQGTQGIHASLKARIDPFKRERSHQNYRALLESLYCVPYCFEASVRGDLGVMSNAPH